MLEVALKVLLKETEREIKMSKIKSDWRGNYFSSSLLNTLRELIVLKGFGEAFIYLIGEKKRGWNKFEQKKIEILIQLIRKLEKVKDLNLETKGYIVGKLNQLLNFIEEEKNEKL